MTKLLETNIYETGESFCDITLKLSDLVFYQRRTYTKILNILGDVGGIMEIFNMVFRFLISFAVDILYETSIINKLFYFELESTKVSFKKEILSKNINIDNNEEDKKASSRILTKIDRKEDFNKNKKYIASQNYKSNLTNSNSLSINKNLFRKRNIGRNNNNLITTSKAVTLTSENTKNENPENKSNKNTIQKIKHNKCFLYFCCLCFYSRKNKEQVIMEKGIDIIKPNLDIISIFRNMYHENKKVKEIKVKEDDLISINMSIFLKKEENEDEKEKKL